MRTEKEIEKQKQNDRAFIVSAVTSELNNIAYLEYFGEWEYNGGMGWFFDLCVEITDKIMFTDGSPYMRWLEHWKSTDTDEEVESFSEFIGYKTCFDWYHMNEALKEFQSRYEKDECTKGQISEHIGNLINTFSTNKDRIDLINMAVDYAKKERDKREYLEKENKIKDIIKQLKDLEVDGETMQHILEKVGMDDQMLRQLIMSSEESHVANLVYEKIRLERY